MNDRPATPRRAFKPKLAIRLVLVLSIAILPLGLISVYQTLKVLEEHRSLSETALLEQTQRTISESREIVQSALSSAQAIAATVAVFNATDVNCDAVTGRVANETAHYMFVGFVDRDLKLACASNGQRRDLSELDAVTTELNSRESEIFMRPLEFLGGGASVNVTVPVFVDEEFLGSIWIAIPIQAVNEKLASAARDDELILFDADGEIIATGEFDDDRRSVLPQSTGLADLAVRSERTFRDTNRVGQTRDFAVVPVVEGAVFALGSWEPRNRSTLLPGYEEALALYFPFIMWAIAIVVAYIGVNRLVIRHVSRLRSWMRLYAAGGASLENARLDNAPEELEVVAEAFRAMTRRLSEQDRRREEDLQEKTTLLREVHHRVKNNLQLISSMMNMQIRTTESDEAKRLLRRVQDRVMALSAIHRYLYLARKLSLVRADKLLEDIIQQLIIVGTVDETRHQVKISTEFDEIEISPDQSVPLSLLATEASMNAVKYCGLSEEGEAWINIALKRIGEDEVCLSIVNSLPADYGEEAGSPMARTGLGSRLIDSFVSQLGGSLEINDLPGRFELHMTFALSEEHEEEKAA